MKCCLLHPQNVAKRNVFLLQSAMQPTKNDELELFAIRCDDVIDALIFIPHRLWIMAHLYVYVCA